MLSSYHDAAWNNVFGQRNFYQVLNIPINANEAVIRRAFRAAALQYHPDKTGGSEEEFKAIERARLILIGEDRNLSRVGYDNALSQYSAAAGVPERAPDHSSGASNFSFEIAKRCIENANDKDLSDMISESLTVLDAAMILQHIIKKNHAVGSSSLHDIFPNSIDALFVHIKFRDSITQKIEGVSAVMLAIQLGMNEIYAEFFAAMGGIETMSFDHFFSDFISTLEDIGDKSFEQNLLMHLLINLGRDNHDDMIKEYLKAPFAERSIQGMVNKVFSYKALVMIIAGKNLASISSDTVGLKSNKSHSPLLCLEILKDRMIQEHFFKDMLVDSVIKKALSDIKDAIFPHNTNIEKMAKCLDRKIYNSEFLKNQIELWLKYFNDQHYNGGCEINRPLQEFTQGIISALRIMARPDRGSSDVQKANANYLLSVCEQAFTGVDRALNAASAAASSLLPAPSVSHHASIESSAALPSASASSSASISSDHDVLSSLSRMNINGREIRERE